MKLVILITNQTELALDIALAWQEAGAPGVTIVRAHGIHTLQQEVKRGAVELPRMVTSMAAAMAHIIDQVEERSELLLSLVEEGQIDALITAADTILGDLNAPNTGILFTVDVERAIGVRQHGAGSS